VGQLLRHRRLGCRCALAAYATLALSSIAVRSHAHEALFAVGGAAVLFLFVGIHNAWDSTAYHVFVRGADRDRE
jgi:hypothetical protein